MKFKHTFRNYGILLVAPILHVPIGLLMYLFWKTNDLIDYFEDNIWDSLPRLDMDYSEDIAKAIKAIKE